MFSSTITGGGAALNMIAKKEGKLKTGMYLVTLKTATELQAESKPRTPKKSGLLRANSRVTIRTPWLGKYIKPSSGIIARTGRHKIAARRIKRTADMSSLNASMSNAKRGVRAAVYNNLPYANKRDKEGGLVLPRGFLSGLANKYHRIHHLRLRRLVYGVSRL
jgi:hypothetical protein